MMGLYAAFTVKPVIIWIRLKCRRNLLYIYAHLKHLATVMWETTVKHQSGAWVKERLPAKLMFSLCLLMFSSDVLKELVSQLF